MSPLPARISQIHIHPRRVVMGMMKEFRDFAMKGNVVDMAVGIIIGAAFGKIVSSLVSDVIMPPIGVLLGNVDFSSLAFTLSEATESTPAVTIKYGVFINTIIDFVIVAFAIFLVIKQMNRLKKPAPAPAATTKDCPHCLMSVPLKASKCGHCTSELKAA
jgi:large conductance mechanosensitive channel